MITGTLITVLSIPMYWGLFHALGLMGLAIASDIGILVQTAALVAFAATAAAAHFLPPVSTHAKDILTIALASIAWLAAAALTLFATGSKLPAQILRRK